MIRTAAAIVAVLALVVVAWSAYRVAEAEEEQACWAEISATADVGQAMAIFPSGALVTVDAYQLEGSVQKEIWEERTTAYDNMFDACKAL